jgi:small subunit ribosomal protein S18
MARMERENSRDDRRGSRGGDRDRDRDRMDMGMVKQRRSIEGVKSIDCRDYDLLSRFVTEYGKILPARLTGANPKQQRQIKRSVRRARNIGLMA